MQTRIKDNYRLFVLVFIMNVEKYQKPRKNLRGALKRKMGFVFILLESQRLKVYKEAKKIYKRHSGN